MPNIENLKKQAKRCLRWHRNGHVPVSAQIRRFLARYDGWSDRQILAADFKLSDAQELVARKHGFDDWPSLAKGIAAMPTSPDALGSGGSEKSGSTILSAEPQLFVADMDRACRFYTEQLGFKVGFSYGQPAFYVQIRRDEARLNLRAVEGPVFDSTFRTREHDALAATLTLHDAKPLFVAFRRAGVRFHQTLKTQPWGARTFIVADPDGNLICFAGRAAGIEQP